MGRNPGYFYVEKKRKNNMAVVVSRGRGVNVTGNVYPAQGGVGKGVSYSMTQMHFEYGPPGFVECGNPKR